MSYYGDYPQPVFISQVIRRTRRVRCCCECHGTITVGERYENASGKWDGSFDTFATCTHRLVARDWIKDRNEGYVFGELLEALREGEYDPNEFEPRMSVSWKDAKGDLLPIPTIYHHEP